MRSLAIALVLFAGPAAAFPCVLPPPQFDHEPSTRYRVHTVTRLPSACQGAAACTLMDTNDIYMPADAKGAWRACLLRHEKGHVNGWAADHPHARQRTF